MGPEAKLAQAQAELEMAETMVQRAQIERDRAAVENVEAAEESAKAQVTRAEVALDDAAKDVERKRPLALHNIVAAGDWERVQNAHRSAQAQVTASRALELSQAATIGAAVLERSSGRSGPRDQRMRLCSGDDQSPRAAQSGT